MNNNKITLHSLKKILNEENIGTPDELDYASVNEFLALFNKKVIEILKTIDYEEDPSFMSRDVKDLLLTLTTDISEIGHLSTTEVQPLVDIVQHIVKPWDKFSRQ